MEGYLNVTVLEKYSKSFEFMKYEYECAEILFPVIFSGTRHSEYLVLVSEYKRIIRMRTRGISRVFCGLEQPVFAAHSVEKVEFLVFETEASTHCFVRFSGTEGGSGRHKKETMHFL